MQNPPGKKRTFIPITDEQLYKNPLLYLLLVPYNRIYHCSESQVKPRPAETARHPTQAN